MTAELHHSSEQHGSQLFSSILSLQGFEAVEYFDDRQTFTAVLTFSIAHSQKDNYLYFWYKYVVTIIMSNNNLV